jgi:polysaccharide export outer membrane protein
MTLDALVRWVALAGLLLAPTPAQAQTPPGGAPAVVLAPGDLVRIVVWQKPELSGEFVVTPEGTLAHPLYQDVPVAGVTLAVAKQRLRDFLAQSYTKDPLLTVEPLFRVTVGGEVRQPNVLTVPRGTTVAQAVALGGGVAERGRASGVRLLRGGRTYQVDLTRPEPDATTLQVLSGDQIIVPRGHNFFRDVLAPLASLTAAVASVIAVTRL